METAAELQKLTNKALAELEARTARRRTRASLNRNLGLASTLETHLANIREVQAERM